MEFSEFNLSRVIFEIKYDNGFLYWDNCGATNLEIVREFPAWGWEKSTAELSLFRKTTNKIELIFNIHNIRFTQDEVDNLNQLKKATKEITPIILKNLEINKFTRVGNRFRYVLPLEDTKQGDEIVNKSKLIVIPDNKLMLFGSKPKKTSFLIYVKEDNLQYRIELTTIKRIDSGGIGKLNEKYFPKFGLRADIDFAIIDKVGFSDIAFDEFIQKNFKFLESNLVKLISK